MNECVLVIFGITGDLNKRLLFPAVCNLGAAGLLPSNIHIIGIGLGEFTPEAFRELLKQDIQQFVQNPEAKTFGLSLLNSVDYISGDFSNPEISLWRYQFLSGDNTINSPIRLP